MQHRRLFFAALLGIVLISAGAPASVAFLLFSLGCEFDGHQEI